jgi:hypothetical protein
MLHLGEHMTDTRIAISLTIGILALAIGAVLAIQPYSVRSPWSIYDTPGQRFLSAALRQDSAELQRLSISSGPLDWAVRTAREHPSDLSAWARYGRAGVGVGRGDTTKVLFETATKVCPLLITFVGQQARVRVLEAKPRCYTNR